MGFCFCVRLLSLNCSKVAQSGELLTLETPAKEAVARRLSFSPGESSIDTELFERESLLGESPMDKRPAFQLLDESICGLGKVVKEAWESLPEHAREGARKLVKDLAFPARPFRVTTLCSGTDGVIEAIKD